MAKQIVIITTGQPSTNPRAVKEANSLCAAGYDVTVIYSYLIDWAYKADVKLFRGIGWKHQLIGGSPYNNKKLFHFTRLRFKVATMLNKYFGNKYLIAERSQARAFDEMLKAAKSIKADWYIGHNLGALAIAVKAAQFNNGRAAFDFEDYHREESENAPNVEKTRILFLENKYVNQLNYISAASPMIAVNVANNFPLLKQEVITLLNCFSLKQQPPLRKEHPIPGTLQLLWFSQTIGPNRGLEIIIQALDELNDPAIHLTLLGNCMPGFKTYIDSQSDWLRKQIHLVQPIASDDIPDFAAKFDVGLALELSVPKNHDICLSNKVLVYMLAGNAVLLSETTMQKSFNETFKIGESFPHDNIQILKEKLLLFKDKFVLDEYRKHNYELAKTKLNWENESKPFLDIIRSN